MDLKAIYLTTLERCAPDRLVRAHVTPDMPRNVVAIGKCAGPLLDGVAAIHPIEHAFVAVPEGYRLPVILSREDGEGPPADAEDARQAGGPSPSPRLRMTAEIHVGGHPHMTRASFEAGRALLAFVDAHDDILFLVSGGGSACVEVPLSDEATVARANAEWIASGMPIAEINARRRTMSAIKGGKLAKRVRGRAVTLVYSDVSTGALHDVASGPTLPGSEALLVADNTTLVRAAARLIGDDAVVIDEQIEGDVEEAARFLADRARALRPGQVLVAGGEPTVVVRGDGRGGRCTELAVRFAMSSACEAVFASSDGVDGNSGVAGFALPIARDPLPGPNRFDRTTRAAGHESRATGHGSRATHLAARGLNPAQLEAALARSDSYAVAAQIGEPIMIASTGNNLRDLFLVACV